MALLEWSVVSRFHPQCEGHKARDGHDTQRVPPIDAQVNSFQSLRILPPAEYGLDTCGLKGRGLAHGIRYANLLTVTCECSNVQGSYSAQRKSGGYGSLVVHTN
jgi:hypothetical protein